MTKKAYKALPFLIIIILFILFFVFDLQRYISFDELKQHHTAIKSWTQANFIIAYILFICAYIITSAISLPFATLFTLSSGYLFGPWWGTVATVFSASIGGFLLFLASKFAFKEFFIEKFGDKMVKLENGIRENAFNYIFFVRVVPAFPFWLINIVAGILNVPSKTFFVATFIGIIPASFIYVLVGNSLGKIFDANQSPDLSIIFQPVVILPLLALGVLALIPVFYKKISKKKRALK